ncbi:membrane progestin receptor gamma-B [Trichomycterus rosablanca]|uniref:membrane progestin receptor gamma-B n=1 Tax=Trichomycterus rosablanca TaxID=2290929 RepID=UPI002F353D35
MLGLVRLPPVFDADQIPKDFQEDGIISGYRHPRSSAVDCVLGLFRLTNETLNVWTHFLPTWYFLWKLLTLLYARDVWTDAYAWPLVVYLFSCCVYPLASSCAHTFSAMSTCARHICFFFDYGALSFYSLGSAIAYSAYALPDAWVNGWFQRFYVPVAVVNSVICTSVACYSRFPETRRPTLSKVLRVFAFTYPYLFDNIPLFYRIFLCVGDGCTTNEADSLHVNHTFLAFLTGFLFATHLPERLAPGRFDYVGHSHQLFHVCGILGTGGQLRALQLDMNLRRSWLQVNAQPITFGGTLGASALALILSLGVISIFSQYLVFIDTVHALGSGAKSESRPKKKRCCH